VIAHRNTWVLLLGAGAGWVDAVGFIGLGHVFLAHMSGNSAWVGVEWGRGNLWAGLPHLIAIVVFVFGIIAGTWIAEGWTTKQALPRFGDVLAVEAGLLTCWLAVAVGVHLPATGAGWHGFLAALPALAMGLQNATLRRLGGIGVHTTYVTGVLNITGEELARGIAWCWRRVRRRKWRRWVLVAQVAPRQCSLRRAAWAGSLWVMYVLGAIVGAVSLWRIGWWTLSGPILLLFGARAGVQSQMRLQASP
jgi:uncharacterized membrane protein YoaK (UPF0700 family)